MSERSSEGPRHAPETLRLQRKCADCEEEEDTSRVQRKAASSAAESESALSTQVSETLRSGGGRPLAPDVRAYFEPRFQFDFSKVRIHSDARAAESARTANAHAYTVTEDIVFDTGRFAPHTADGRRLLAHELTHVIQQRGGGGLAAVPRGVSAPSDLAEQEADRVADAVISGEPAPGVSAIVPASVAIQRKCATCAEDNAREDGDPKDSNSGVAEGVTSGNGRIEAATVLLNCAKDLIIKDPSAERTAKALEILEKINTLVSDIAADEKIRKQLSSAGGFNVSYALVICGAARGVPASLIGRIKSGPVSSATFCDQITTFAAAKPYLEILAGDTAVQSSAVVAGVQTGVALGAEILRATVQMTPVLGSLIMLGEAISGTSVTGSQLSTTERALLGGGALLSEVGLLIEAGRLVPAALQVSRIGKVSKSEAYVMVALARDLSASEVAKLKKLSDVVKRGEKLTEGGTVRRELPHWQDDRGQARGGGFQAGRTFPGERREDRRPPREGAGGRCLEAGRHRDERGREGRRRDADQERKRHRPPA
jgi:hypothetical protein